MTGLAGFAAIALFFYIALPNHEARIFCLGVFVGIPLGGLIGLIRKIYIEGQVIRGGGDVESDF